MNRKAFGKKEKKAVSEVVAYVLLIVIALSIAGMVYGWLKFHIPKEKQTCPDGVSIVIKDYSCNATAKEITLDLQNKGLFNIDGFYIKTSNKSGELPVLEPEFKPGTSSKALASERGFLLFVEPLAPNEEFSAIFVYQQYNTISEIEIQPLRVQEKEIVLCADAVIRQNVQGC